MNNDEMKKVFQEFAQRAADVRRLSSPGILTEDTAENYTGRLRDNFKKIGELAIWRSSLSISQVPKMILKIWIFP